MTAPRRVIVTNDSAETIRLRAKRGTKRVLAKYRNALVCCRDGLVMVYRDGCFDVIGEIRARMFKPDELNVWDSAYKAADGPFTHPREAVTRLRRIVRGAR